MDIVPRVSVIAVCYNHHRYVRACLDSIRQQTFKNFELIVVDDHSSDDSVSEIIRWITETKQSCRTIFHDKNVGLCATLNEAVSVAQGEFICIVATDDTWSPDKLEVQVGAFDGADPSVGVVFSDAETMAEDGTALSRRLCDYYREIWGSIPEGQVYEYLIDGCFIPAPTAMMRRSALVQVGPYDEDLDYEDWDMWLRLSREFKVAYIDRSLAKYRIVSTSLQSTLLNKRTVARHRTQFKIFAKHVGNLGVSSQRSIQLRRRMAQDAEALYELNFSDAKLYLLRSAWLTRNWRSLLFFLYCISGRPYLSARRASVKVDKLVSYVSWKWRQLHGRAL